MLPYFCACEVIQIFYVVLCVVIAVHEFDFRLVINGDQWKGNRDSCMFPPAADASVTELPTLSRSTAFSSVRDSTIACAKDCEGMCGMWR